MSGKNPTVLVFRMSNPPQGYLAEYILASRDAAKLYNVVRVLEYFHNVFSGHQTNNEGKVVLDNDGRTIPLYTKTRKAEYHVDDFFTDFESTMASGYSMFRVVEDDEEWYDRYLEIIDKHREAQAQREAQRILREKQEKLAKEKAERDLNRKERRAASKGKNKKKKAGGRKLKEATQ